MFFINSLMFNKFIRKSDFFLNEADYLSYILFGVRMKHISIVVIFSFIVYGELNNYSIASTEDSCYTSPLQKIYYEEMFFTPPKSGAKGETGTLANYNGNVIDMVKCNWKMSYSNPSWHKAMTLVNPNLTKVDGVFFKLTDELDISISFTNSAAEKWQYLPLFFNDWNYDGTRNIPPGENVVTILRLPLSGITYRLRKDIIGGAITIPHDMELYDFYTVAYGAYPIPPQPDMPLFKAMLHPKVFPIPNLCNINDGKLIDVDFGPLLVSKISGSVSDEEYRKDIPLQINCTSRLSVSAEIKLAAATSVFSQDLISTTNSNLSIAVKHNGKLFKPGASTPVQIINGQALTTLTLFPVKENNVKLVGGEFSASAVLTVSAL
ncbi:fimbrial protein [Pantoea dispersa]|uniref:fimbrial protein n=2 Tax=Pantoea dispersa TaxID=59814 RepID=UPI003015C29F